MTCSTCPHEVCSDCDTALVHCVSCHGLRCSCPSQRENKFLHYFRDGKPVTRVRPLA